MLLGVGLKAASVCAFVSMMGFIKAAEGLPGGQLIFFRALLSLGGLVLIVAMRGELGQVARTRRPLGHFWRGLVGTLGMAFTIVALHNLPLPESIAISFATPLVLVVFSALFLGETVHLHRWAVVIVGFLGVVLISSPRLTVFSGGFSFGTGPAVGVLAALAACGFSATVHLLVRKLVQTEPSLTIVFYFFVTSTVFSLATLPFGWVMPTPEQWLLIALVGVTSVAGQVLMTESYRHADMSVLAPFEYLSLVLSALIGYFAFAEVPTWQMLAGSAIVVAAGLFLIQREQSTDQRRRRSGRA